MEQLKREVRIRIEAPPLQSPLQSGPEPSPPSETLPMVYRILLSVSFGFSLTALYFAFAVTPWGRGG